MAAWKSSRSPRPSSHSPALRPTPRKLNRSTAQPMRASALALWNTTFVCIVPPSIGSGWPNTTTARGALEGLLISASSGPTAPGISRTTSANLSPLARDARHILEERIEHPCQLIRPRDHAKMASLRDYSASRMRPEAQVLASQVRRHDGVELVLSGHGKRRYFQTSQVA